MANPFRRLVGELRVGTIRPRAAAAEPPGFSMASEGGGAAGGAGAELPREPSALDDARKMIPGEALAGYVALQAFVAKTDSPEDAAIVLALVFLVVTFVLRFFGTQDPDATRPARTTQWIVVVSSVVAFVALVYASGGRIWWHRTIANQTFYGQVAATALGIAMAVVLGAGHARKRP